MNDYKNGALYIRVSTDRQEELSPDAQRRLLLDYAKSNHIFIDPSMIFQDNGISGRKAEKRPEFMRMIATAKSADHPIDVILVWKFSRFARNQEEAIVYKQALKRQHSVDVVSITEPIIDGVFGSLIERIIEWMDEYYSINLSQEVIRGMTEHAMRGGYQATPCLGYRSETSGEPYVIVPEEAEIVKYIFDAYASGQDATAIARHLNESGYRLKRGGMFEKRKIDYIIRNKFYIGKLAWNGIESDGQHETFISDDLFTAANAVLDSRHHKLKQRNVSACRHWLSGVLVCGECGASLSVNLNAPAPYFQCWKYAKGYHSTSHAITVMRAERYVISYFENIVNGGEFDYEAVAAKPNLDETSMIQQELEKLSAREQRVRNAYEAGIDTLREYKEARDRIRAERARLEALLSEAQVPVDEKSLLERVRGVYNTLISEDADYIEKGNMLRSVVESIVYNKKNNSMSFRLIL